MKSTKRGVSNTATNKGLIGRPISGVPARSARHIAANELASVLDEQHAQERRDGQELRANPVRAFLKSWKARKAIEGSVIDAAFYAEAVVELANSSVVGSALVDGVLTGTRTRRSALQLFKGFKVDPALRARLESQLDQIVRDRTAAIAAFAPRLRELGEELVELPRFDLAKGELRVVRVLLPARPAAAFDYGLALLMTRQDGPGQLCRCRLESCRRFFLAKRSKGAGRIRTEYCDDKCMDAAHKAGNAERLRRSRAARRRK